MPRVVHLMLPKIAAAVVEGKSQREVDPHLTLLEFCPIYSFTPPLCCPLGFYFIISIEELTDGPTVHAFAQSSGHFFCLAFKGQFDQG